MKKAYSDIKKDFKLPEQADATPEKQPFSVPDYYFEDLSKQITSKIELISGLDTGTIDSTFSVPENYFENLPHQINQGIRSSGRRNLWKEWLSVILKPELSLALVSLLVLIWFTFKSREAQYVVIPQSNFSIEEFNASDYIQYLDEYSIIEVLASQEEIAGSNNGTDAYIQYLIDNNIDISQLEYTL
ncbi:MAG: hypothetical protein EYC69_03685 [Bacteroidetes bacterium]|nr:MAG: hypothetical protein EYC69_03685 [Bacteroidota bacterium]